MLGKWGHFLNWWPTFARFCSSFEQAIGTQFKTIVKWGQGSSLHVLVDFWLWECCGVFHLRCHNITGIGHYIFRTDGKQDMMEIRQILNFFKLWNRTSVHPRTDVRFQLRRTLREVGKKYELPSMWQSMELLTHARFWNYNNTQAIFLQHFLLLEM